MANYEPVVFEDSQGNVISNDPVFLAQRTLRAAGITLEDQSPKTQSATTSSDDSSESIEETSEEDRDESGARTYKELKGGDLKAYANERGVDITGMKTVGEVREALRKADADEAAAAEVNAANK